MLERWSSKLHALQTTTEPAFRDLGKRLAGDLRASHVRRSRRFDRLAAEISALQESQATLSAIAGAQAAQPEGLSDGMQRVEYQLADCRGAAVAESRAAQEQLVTLQAALLSQAKWLCFQIQGAAAPAARESS